MEYWPLWKEQILCYENPPNPSLTKFHSYLSENKH